MTENTKLVVYTALFGNYDKLRDPKRKYSGCEFVCFTDQKDLESDIWEIRQVENGELPPAMMNRHYKFFPHLYFPDFEYSLYVDANIRIVGNPAELVSKYMANNVMACPRHFERNCLYEEAKTCIQLGRADELEVNALLERYRGDGFPEHYGLTENNIIYRRHNILSIQKLMNEWWVSVISGPKRDQLSLMYLCWKNDFKIIRMNESARNNNTYFRFHLHECDSQKGIVHKIQYTISGNRDRNDFFKLSHNLIQYVKAAVKFKILNLLVFFIILV